MTRRILTPAPEPVVSVRLVLPAMANPHGMLFGGEALRIVDEVAAIAAIGVARARVVTARIEAVDFEAGVPVGAVLRTTARVLAVGRSSIEIEVDLEASIGGGAPTPVARTRVVCVAVDAEGRPRPLPL